MEGEGYLEFSLGCLPQVVRGSRREGLSFPLILQVLDSTEGRCDSRGRWGSQTLRGSSLAVTRKIITVSDGFYSKVDCFWLEGNHNVELYSIIKVQNIDFDHQYERSRDLPRIAGMILDFSVIKKGSEIGFFSGKPVKLRDRDNGRGAENHLLQDSLSQKLWKQVKEERFCDVTFTFLDGTAVKAQKNALIANSSVFEAQFDGGFSDASSEFVPIEDTEPKYMRGLLQFIFTRFLPLLSLRQAFEMLYLARKYLIEDLENYTKNFILNNKQTVAGATDVFLYLEMNVKAMDDDIRQFAWAQLKSKANIFIRQPRFLEIDFATLENLLSESGLNCHEWELAQALRRWVVANEAQVKCHQEDDEANDTCSHQLLEALRWDSIPLAEAVVIASWTEFQLAQRDPAFLPDLLLKPRPSQSYGRSANDVLSQQYSKNRLHQTKDDFVIYTNLGVNLSTLVASCLHGRKLDRDSEKDTHCQTSGHPFELSHYQIVPSYGLRLSRCNRKIEVLVNLACSGKSFEVDGGFTGHSKFTKLKAHVTLTAFSFIPSVAAKSLTRVVEFLPETDSCHLLSLSFPREELSTAFIHEVENIGQCMDLQVSVVSDLSNLTEGERKSSKPSLMKHTLRSRRAAAPAYRGWDQVEDSWSSSTRDLHRINSVGRTMQRLRCREGVRDVRWQDGWGNVARSPQWRSPERDAFVGHVVEDWAERELNEVQQWDGNNSRAQEQQDPRREDLSIEVMSPEYLEQSEAFGDITRSPQSPEWHTDSPASPEANPWRTARDTPMSPVYSPSCPDYRPSARPITPPTPDYIPHSPVYHPEVPRSAPRSPSPGEGPSHRRWDAITSRSSERDPRKRARRHSPEGLPGFNCSGSGPIYPSVQRSPSSPPFSPLSSLSPPFSPHHESTEAAAGSRPSSPIGQVWTASPQASPPRHPYSPILFVRSPGQGRDPRSSPAYHPPGSQSPDVIDIDLEEMEPPTDEVVEDGGEEDVSRDLEDPEQVVVNMAEDHHDDQEEVEVAQPEEGVSSEI